MQIPASSQLPPTATVDNSATVVRGFSTEVRSDVPPVQQSEGVRYTRGRPSDNETYSSLSGSRKKNDAGSGAESGADVVLSTPAQTIDEGAVTSEQKQQAPLRSNEQPTSGDSDTLKSSSQESSSLKSAAKEQQSVTLSPEDQALVEQLQKRDREVRLHEQAHQSAGGRYTGSADYDYQRGPDGRNYAVGGEVSIDAGTTSNPAEAIQKAKQIRAAALAPAQPSAQDRRVAADAEQMIADAQQQLRAQEQAAAKAELNARNEALKKKAEEREAANAEPVSTVPEQKSAKVERRPTVTVNSASESKPAEPRTEETESSDEGEEENQSVEKKDKITAREALEIILLAGKTLNTQANVSGYVSPEAPAGASGLLDVVI